MAFAGRYGALPPTQAQGMSARNLILYADALGQILQEEAEASRPKE